MSNKPRSKAGRPAREPQKFPRAIRDCSHERGRWNIPALVANIWDQDSPELELSDDPTARVVGHLLRVEGIQCLDCGERFRFANLPTKGDPMHVPVMLNGNVELITKIEPDRKIITPDDTKAGRIVIPGWGKH